MYADGTFTSNTTTNNCGYTIIEDGGTQMKKEIQMLKKLQKH